MTDKKGEPAPNPKQPEQPDHSSRWSGILKGTASVISALAALLAATGVFVERLKGAVGLPELSDLQLTGLFLLLLIVLGILQWDHLKGTMALKWAQHVWSLALGNRTAIARLYHHVFATA